MECQRRRILIHESKIILLTWAYSEGKNGKTGLYSSITKDQGATFGPRQLVAAGSVRGTPVLFRSRDGIAAIWQSVEGRTGTVLIAPRISDSKSSSSSVVANNAELPAATANDSKLFVAYIAKADQRQSVWLVSAAEQKLGSSRSSFVRRELR